MTECWGTKLIIKILKRYTKTYDPVRLGQTNKGCIYKVDIESFTVGTICVLRVD